jgi:5'-nucleotidase
MVEGTNNVEQKPLVLLTNDDGFAAQGIRALRQALRAWAKVIVMAPVTEQSATSHSLSLHHPLRLNQEEEDVFSLTGTPADCVYVALFAEQRVVPTKPELVVSGLNHGPNLGYDIFYSGTVAAAREASFRGIPALATSASLKGDFEQSAELASKVAYELWQEEREKSLENWQETPLYNLNIPAGEGPWPVRVTNLGRRRYDEQVVFSTDPRGREYLWIAGSRPTHPLMPGTDTEAYDQNVASLTRLRLDMSYQKETEQCTRIAQRVNAQLLQKKG